MDGSWRRRSSLKTHHPDWKEKLKQCCLVRVKEERSRLLWKIRSSGQQTQEKKDILELVLRDIVSDELQKIKQSSLDENQRNLVPNNNDMIWEFDGLHVENSHEAQSEELMLEMQRLLYEDLREELIRRDLEFFEQEDEYLAQAVLENMNLNDNQNAENDKVWCPMCKRELREKHRLIYCTYCNLRLDSGNNEVNLNFLKSRLGEVYMDHLNRGCKATPNFCMQTMFNLSALFIQCEACDTFEVVI